MRSAAEYNEWTFDFLRRRRDFVANFGPDPYAEKIEQHVVWGATVAALGRIHARRMKRKVRPDGNCFIQALLDLTPAYGLATVSIPLLGHDIRSRAPTLRREHPIVVYERAAKSSLHWSSEKDRELSPALEALRTKQPPKIKDLFDRNRYAAILYHDYRCSAVHGLDFGPRTMDFPAPEDTPPIYRNFMAVPEAGVPPERHVRTRIMFPLGYLTEILSAMIEREEHEAADAEWRVPSNATLDDA